MKNNNPFLAGIPDCWYSGILDDLWVEYKYLAIETPRVTVVPDLSQQQLHWIKTRRDEGREIWVVVGYKKGVVMFRHMTDIEQGISPELFIERTISRKELADEITAYCGTTRTIDNQQRELQERS